MNLKPSGNFKTDHRPSSDSKMLQSCDPQAVITFIERNKQNSLGKILKKRDKSLSSNISAFKMGFQLQEKKTKQQKPVCCAV